MFSGPSLNSVDIMTGRCAVQPLSSDLVKVSLTGFGPSRYVWAYLVTFRWTMKCVFGGSPRYPRGMRLLDQVVARWRGAMVYSSSRTVRNGVIEKFDVIISRSFSTRL